MPTSPLFRQVGVVNKIGDIQASSLLDDLRSKTRAAHEALHRHASFVALFNGSIDHAKYVSLTQQQLGFYSHLDRAIEAAVAKDTIDFDYAPRSVLLRQDIEDLNAEPVFQTPIQTDAKAFEYVTPSTLGGILYVVEGATLGGSQIDRAAQRTLSKDNVAGRRYWAWCRSNAQQRWAMVLADLEQRQVAGRDRHALIEGAEQTFTLFGAWLAPLNADVPVKVAAV